MLLCKLDKSKAEPRLISSASPHHAEGLERLELSLQDSFQAKRAIRYTIVPNAILGLWCSGWRLIPYEVSKLLPCRIFTLFDDTRIKPNSGDLTTVTRRAATKPHGHRFTSARLCDPDRIQPRQSTWPQVLNARSVNIGGVMNCWLSFPCAFCPKLNLRPKRHWS